MSRKTKINISTNQKLEYAKLMVEEDYTNQQIQDICGASSSAISRWKRQYLAELTGQTPIKSNALTTEQQRIQLLEKELKQALRDNEILKKATAFFIRDNQSLN